MIGTEESNAAICRGRSITRNQTFRKQEVGNVIEKDKGHQNKNYAVIQINGSTRTTPDTPTSCKEACDRSRRILSTIL